MEDRSKSESRLAASGLREHDASGCGRSHFPKGALMANIRWSRLVFGAMFFVASISNAQALPKGDERQAAIDAREDRAKKCSMFLNVLTSPSAAEEIRCYAAYALGELRSSEAVSALIERLGLRGDNFPQDTIALFGKYPCAEALVKIGNSSLPALQDFLGRTDVKQVAERELALRVLLAIDGPEIAETRLRIAKKSAKSKETGSRLDDALEKLKSSHPIRSEGMGW
jgi:hypothetical protein